MLLGLLRRREEAPRSRTLGSSLAVTVCRQWLWPRLALSPTLELAGTHRGAVAALDVDTVEQRYVLAGMGDGSLCIYDLHAVPPRPPARRRRHPLRPRVSLTPVVAIRRGAPNGGHAYGVSGVSWLRTDTGAFVTGSLDEHVKVWDANVAAVALDFHLRARVHGIALPAAAAGHCLIAAAAELPAVHLCDPRSGALTHTLGGHGEGAHCAVWSPSSPHLLATGSSAGQLRLWDIRRAGALMLLDAHNSGDARLDPAGAAAASTGGGGAAGDAVRRGHEGAVDAIRFTPSGAHLLSSGRDGRLRCWDATGGRNLLVNYHSDRGYTRGNSGLAVSPDGGVVALPCGQTVQVFDAVRGGAPLVTLRGHLGDVVSAAFHPHDDVMLTGGADRLLLAWTSRRSRGEGDMADQDAWSDS